MSRIRDLVRPHVRELEPYPPGKPIEELERELGIQGSIKMASNESPLGPSRRAVEAILREAEQLNRYPDGSCYYLRQALAKELSADPAQFVFGAGSDELLELLVKTFIGPGDEVVYAWPSFAMYPIVTQGMGGTPVAVALDDVYRVDAGALLDAVTERTRLLFLANPNNPTGTSMGRDDFERLVGELPDHVVLVADEAYYEYVRRPDYPQSIPLIAERPTLVVLRTMSKIYGLAGLRVGYAVADPELSSYLERARHPFNVSSIAQSAALAALEDREHVERVRALTHEGLAQLERGFAELGLESVPTDANFILVEVGEDAGQIYERLLRRGVITRPLGAFGLDRHLRVTAGLPEENERLLGALRLELQK
jgi:histidinol-phosphate aminotransferase